MNNELSIPFEQTTDSKSLIRVSYKILVSLQIVLAIMLVTGIYRVGSNSMLSGGFFGAFFIFLGAPAYYKTHQPVFNLQFEYRFNLHVDRRNFW